MKGEGGRRRGKNEGRREIQVGGGRRRRERKEAFVARGHKKEGAHEDGGGLKSEMRRRKGS